MALKFESVGGLRDDQGRAGKSEKRTGHGGPPEAILADRITRILRSFARSAISRDTKGGAMSNASRWSALAFLALAAHFAPGAAVAAEGCVRLVNQGSKSVPGHVMMQSREWTTFRLNAGETKVVCVKGAEMFPDNQLYLVLKGGLGSPLFDCRVTARNEIQILEIKQPDGSTRPRAECR
jgi:hypothetical protein